MTSIGDQLREQTVDTVLGRIRLQVGGSGSPIVFWPSLLMTGDMWHGVADDLVARRQVVLVDPPGQGGSQPLTELVQLRRLRPLCGRHPRRARHRQGSLRRQFLGRHDRCDLRRDLPRTDRGSGADELHCRPGQSPPEGAIRDPACTGEVVRWDGTAAESACAEGIPRADHLSASVLTSWRMFVPP